MPPHPYLISVADLPRYGLSWAFLDQFKPFPIEVKISTAGVLGTMKVQWRRLGEVDYSAVITSSPQGTWTLYLDEAGTVLVFGAGTYVLNSVYTINEAGTVTIAGGGIATVTATRYDIRDTESQAATDLALSWMSPEVVGPLVSWGADIKSNYAAVLSYLLKSKVGMAPTQSAVGDENVRLRYEDAREWFQRVGAGSIDPVDLVDSSADGTVGAGFAAPDSDERRGW